VVAAYGGEGAIEQKPLRRHVPDEHVRVVRPEHGEPAVVRQRHAVGSAIAPERMEQALGRQVPHVHAPNACGDEARGARKGEGAVLVGAPACGRLSKRGVGARADVVYRRVEAARRDEIPGGAERDRLGGLGQQALPQPDASAPNPEGHAGVQADESRDGRPVARKGQRGDGATVGDGEPKSLSTRHDVYRPH
jgi:hypothetical protein